jgi:hypothetical protein
VMTVAFQRESRASSKAAQAALEGTLMLVAKSFMTIERSKKWLKRPDGP